MYIQHTQWGIDDKIDVIRVDADPEEPTRLHQPAVALYGDAAADPEGAGRQARPP